MAPKKKKTSVEKKSAERRAEERWKKEMDKIGRQHEKKQKAEEEAERFVESLSLIFAKHQLKKLYDELADEKSGIEVLEDLAEDERVIELADKIAPDIFDQFPELRPEFGMNLVVHGMRTIWIETEIRNHINVEWDQEKRAINEAIATAIVLSYKKLQDAEKRRVNRLKRAAAAKKKSPKKSTAKKSAGYQLSPYIHPRLPCFLGPRLF